MASKRVIFTVGVPGAGKSTYAEGLGDKFLRLERDRFRDALFRSRLAYHARHGDDPARRRSMSFVIGSAMFSAMQAALTEDSGEFDGVVISDTCLYWSSIQRFHGIAMKHRAKIEAVVFNIPEAVIWERNETRDKEHHVPDDVLRNCLRSFQTPKTWEEQWWMDNSKVAHRHFMEPRDAS